MFSQVEIITCREALNNAKSMLLQYRENSDEWYIWNDICQQLKNKLNVYQRVNEAQNKVIVDNKKSRVYS